MRILIITDAWYPQLNGVVRTYEALKQELENKGHDVIILSPQNFKYKYPMPGYKEISLTLFPYHHLLRLISESKSDIIHIATEGPLGWAARKYCLKNNLSFTTSYHTQFPDYVAKRVAKIFPFLYNFSRQCGIAFIKKFHNPALSVLVTTKSMTEELQSWGLKAPIKEFTKGLDFKKFYPGSSDILNHLPRPIALYVGRLAIEKNIEEFLDMEWSGSKVVVGHGPDAKKLKKKYPAAHFTGKKTGKELADHYRASDVFVFPSTTDTFGIVLIEALACGLPVAAHNAIGPKDVILFDDLGCLNEDLSKAAFQALKNNDALNRHEYVKNNYTWEKAATQFIGSHKDPDI